MEVFANETITQVRSSGNGRLFEVTCHKGGRLELYQEYRGASGLMQFVGYLDEILPLLPATAVRDIKPLINANEKAHKDFWATFLPGADQWVHGTH